MKRVQVQSIGDVIPNRPQADYRGWLQDDMQEDVEADSGQWTNNHEATHQHLEQKQQQEGILPPEEQILLRKLRDFKVRAGAKNTRMPQNYRGDVSFLVRRGIPKHWLTPQMSDDDVRLVGTAYFCLKHHMGGGLTKPEAVQLSELMHRNAVQFGVRDFVRAPVESTLDAIGKASPSRVLIRGLGGKLMRGIGGAGPEQAAHDLYDNTVVGPLLDHVWKYGWKGIKGGYGLMRDLAHAYFSQLWEKQDPVKARRMGLREDEDDIPGGGGMAFSDDPNAYGKLARRATQFERDEFLPPKDWTPDNDDDDEEWNPDWTPHVAPYINPSKIRWPGANEDGSNNQDAYDAIAEQARNGNPWKPPQSNNILTDEDSISPTDLLNLMAGKLGPNKPMSQENISRLVKRLQSAGILDSTGRRENLGDKFTAAPEGAFTGAGGQKFLHGDSAPLLRYLEAYENFRKQAEQTPQMSVDADAPNAYAQHVRRATQFAIPKAHDEYGQGSPRKHGGRKGDVVNRKTNRLSADGKPIAPHIGGIKRGKQIIRDPNLRIDTSHAAEDKWDPEALKTDQPAWKNRRTRKPVNASTALSFSADDYAADLAARHPEYYGEPGHNAHFTPVLPQSMLGHRG